MTDKAPTPKATTETNEQVDDLDALMVSRSLDPVNVKFLGREWTIRRDFTADEVVKFWLLVNNNKPEDAFSMVVGKKEAAEFVTKLGAFPDDLLNVPLRAFYRKAGLLRRVDGGGQKSGEA